MKASNPQRVKQLFQEAVDRPEAERRAFVATACGDDASLRSDVEALLSAHDEVGAFLASPTNPSRGDAAAAHDTADAFARLQRALAGRYSLERELGRGGMGIVYLARDVALDRPVAIKLLPPALVAHPDSRERFLREARTAASLSHPNIVPIHLVEERDDLVYFVMAHVDGETLGDRVRRAGPLKPADAATMVQEVAWALAYAHGRGVIHRDVKPDNILLDKGSGRALVTDFGIARVASTQTVSQQGEVLGTLRYMSPEQATAESEIDGRADLYSLGVTAFFALTGRLPFESENPAALVAMHVSEPAPPLKSITGSVPARLAEAVDRCLAKDPDARFATGESLAEAIADSQITRREIAPSVREFLSAAKNGIAQLTGLGMLWAVVILELPSRVVPARPMIGDPLFPVVVILAGITVIVGINLLRATRGVARAGLDEHDVAEAVELSVHARDANVEYELARAERLAKRLETPWARASMALLGMLPLMYVPQELAEIYRAGFGLTALLELFWISIVVVAGPVFLIGLAAAPSRVIAPLTQGTSAFARLWGRFWRSAVARWLFKFAGIGLKKGKSLPAPDSAPTEVLLGRAAGELFAQLPKDQRARLGDVRDVVGGLERAAATLRARRDELAAAVADVGEPGTDARRHGLLADLQSAQVTAEQRLARAVSALESLRLDLLRLKAGVGAPDDLTAVIEEARAVREAVDVEVAARREVEAVTERE